MSAMADMSRAIRLEIERHAPTLRALPDEVLREYVQIVGAYYEDLRNEATQREKEGAAA